MPNEYAYFIVENVCGNRSIGQIEQRLDQLHGVTNVSVNPQTHLVCVGYNSSGTSYDQIENCLNKMGFQIAADASEILTR